MPSVVTAPQVLGAGLVVSTEAALALVDITGMTLGTAIYVSGTDAFFALKVSGAALLAGSVVAVAGVQGLRWLSSGFVSPSGQTAFPAGSDAAPSVLVGPVADEVGLADVAQQLRLCAGGTCGASVSAGGSFNALGTFAHLGANIGFFSTAPTVKQTGPVLNITNSVTVGGVNGTIADFADLAVYANSAAAIRNDIFQLARGLKFVSDAMRAYGLIT